MISAAWRRRIDNRVFFSVPDEMRGADPLETPAAAAEPVIRTTSQSDKSDMFPLMA